LYDRIICNPPFFSASFKAPSKERTLARHDDSLSLDEFFQGCILLMEKSAGISLILPAEKEASAFDLSSQHRMHCHRLTRVKPAPGKPCKRVLLEFSFLPGECEENDLAIETGSRHVYTEEFKQLVADFYL
jgi:tRNA1Val (adenine37-N6)-methyltransferase